MNKFTSTYIVSLLAIILIWSISPEIIKEPRFKEQNSENERVVEPIVQYIQAPKGFFGYIYDILTTIIRVVNIVTFGYQMRDRRKKR